MRKFKIRASALSKIMGGIGLTDVQESRLIELHNRKSDPNAKPLTANMENELAELIHKRDNPELPKTAQSYLEEWYADEEKQLHTKEIDKGIMCEHECIQFMAQVLELGIAEKNRDQFEDEYKTGCPDVILPDCVIDVKCPWDKRLLQSKCNGIEHDYYWQAIQYLIMTKRNRFILFYGLMDTDGSLNYGEDVIYSELPDDERWIAYQLDFTDEQLYHYETQINQRVELCRAWLERYDQRIRSKMGKINAKQTR